MLKQYRLTIWYIARTDGELQFLVPMLIEAVGEMEASRTAIALANLMLTEFAAKVLVRIEGDNFNHVVEIIQPR